VCADDLPRDVEPDAEARRLVGVGQRALEALEDALLVGACDPGPFVGDLDDDLLPRTARAHRHPRALGPGRGLPRARSSSQHRLRDAPGHADRRLPG
jgi:hypothetical protein